MEPTSIDSLLGQVPLSVWWAAAGAGLLLLELALPGFVVASFGVSALAAGGLAALDLPLAAQIATFGLGGAALVMPARRLLHKDATALPSSVEKLPGRRGLCVARIDGELRPGTVKLDGTRWTAVTEPGVVIEDGEAVLVVEREGNRLTVVPEV